MNDRYEFYGTKADLLWGQLMLKALELALVHDIKPTKGAFAGKTDVYARQTAAIELVRWAVGGDDSKMKITYQENE